MRYGTKQILLLGLCFWFGKNCFGMKETGDAQKAITTLRGWIQMRPGSDTYSDEIKQDDIKNYVLRIAKTKNCDLKVEIEGEHRSVPVIADIILEAAKIKDKYDDIFQKLGNCLSFGNNLIPEKEELIFNTRGYVKFYPINIIGYKREKNGLFFFVAWFFSLKNLRYIVACQKGYRSKVFTQEEQEEVLFYIAKYYTDSDTLRKVLNKKEIIREKSSRSKSDPSDKLNEDTICSLLQKAAQSVIEEENSVELIPQTEKSAFSLKGKNLPKIQKQEVPKKKKEVNATNSWWGTLVFGGAVIAIVVAIIWNKKFTKTR